MSQLNSSKITHAPRFDGEPEKHDFLSDYIAVYLRMRPRSSNKIPKRYLEYELSSQQIADEFGVSKQSILTQLRIAGIRKMARCGRSTENYRFHNPPYGYKARNGKLEIDTREMKVARLIVELRDRQGKSFPEIANVLNQRGCRSPCASAMDGKGLAVDLN